MRRTAIVIIIALGTLFAVAALAPPARAQLLPSCERTLYELDEGGVTNGDDTFLLNTDSRGNPMTPVLVVPADKYDEAKHGKVTGLTTNRDCGLEDFVRLFINLAQWGFGILAFLALLLFLWGGFRLLTSGGNAERVEGGKKVIAGSLTGLVVVLGAWVFVGFWVALLTGTSAGTIFAGTGFSRSWFGEGSCRTSQEFRQHNCRISEAGLYRGCSDQPGTRTGDVQAAQTKLTFYGCDPGPVDGCFGERTEQAVGRFQAANGLLGLPDPPPDIPASERGVIKSTTWQLLVAAGLPCP